MIYRSFINTALSKAQNYSGEVIVALCRASDEENYRFRREYLTEAREHARKILQSIDDALAVEQEKAA